eukprot:jgi/Chlat1/437/Chrsp103S00002
MSKQQRYGQREPLLSGGGDGEGRSNDVEGGGGGGGAVERYSSPAAAGFDFGPRPRQDTFFTVLYVLVVASVVAGAVYSSMHFNSDFAVQNTPEYLNDPKHCPRMDSVVKLGVVEAVPFTSLSRVNGVASVVSLQWFGSITLHHQPNNRKHASGNDDEDERARALLKAVAIPIGVSLISSIVIGMLFLYTLKSIPRTCVWGAVALQVAVPAAVGVFLLVSSAQIGEASIGGFVSLGTALAMAVAFYMLRGRLELTASILEVSSTGLRDNPFLASCSLLCLAVTIFLKLVLLAVLIPMLLASLLAQANGFVAPNQAITDESQSCGGEGEEACCVWQTDDWVRPYQWVLRFAMAWTTLLIFQIRFYTVSGSIAQWYFAGPERYAMHGTTRRSLGHALGPSFGTLCFSSLVLVVINYLRSATEELRKRRQNAIAAIATLLLECFFTAVEFVNKFAVVRCAVTGESFLVSSKRTAVLLTRNALSVIIVDSVASWVLRATALVLALVWGAGSYVLLDLLWTHYPVPGYTGEDAAGLALGVTIATFAIVFIVLLFFADVLLNVIDAVYFCYAIDKDANTVTDERIHSVYSHLPAARPSPELQQAVAGYEGEEGRHAQPAQGYPSAYPQVYYPPPPGYRDFNATARHPQ